MQQFRFDEFELDFERFQLQREGLPVKLENIPLQLLMLLAERRGQIVSREEIVEKLWGKNVFLDAEQGINTAVRKVRLVLRDHPERPRYIQTVVGKGYRFVPPVDRAPNQTVSQGLNVLAEGNGKGYQIGQGRHAAAEASISPIREDVSAYYPRPIRWKSQTVWSLAFAVVLLVMGFVTWRRVRTPKELSSQPLEIVPLTGLPGKQRHPSFSPDGSQVTFALATGSKEDAGLYTTLVGGEKPLRLTDDPGDSWPAWSPDGQVIAFVRRSETSVDIYTIPPLGGTARKLYSLSSRVEPAPAWSPDGKVLAFSDANGGGLSAITLLSLGDRNVRILTSPPVDHHDGRPVFSPDGRWIAFIRTSGPALVDDLYVVRAEGGSPRRLTYDNRAIYGRPAWMSGGTELVFSSMRAGLASLWRVPAAGGEPQPVPQTGTNTRSPAISTHGSRLAYQLVHQNSNIRQITLKDPKHAEGPARMLISAQEHNLHPQFSPDGRKIAFESSRAGYTQVWICDRDGSNAVQVTTMPGLTGTPRWSPDGRYLAFDFRPKEQSEIYVAEVPNGVPRQITTVPGANNVVPSWSRDGRWIYFASRGNSTQFEVWKVPVQGGPAVQLTRNGGFAPMEAKDGYIYYTRGFHVPGIWKISPGGGTAIPVMDVPDAPEWWDWAVVPEGMYFVNSRSAPEHPLEFLEFATGKRYVLGTVGHSQGVAISPDGNTLLYAQNDRDDEEIVVTKNFH